MKGSLPAVRDHSRALRFSFAAETSACWKVLAARTGSSPKPWIGYSWLARRPLRLVRGQEFQNCCASAGCLLVAVHRRRYVDMNGIGWPPPPLLRALSAAPLSPASPRGNRCWQEPHSPGHSTIIGVSPLKAEAMPRIQRADAASPVRSSIVTGCKRFCGCGGRVCRPVLCPPACCSGSLARSEPCLDSASAPACVG